MPRLLPLLLLAAAGLAGCGAARTVRAPGVLEQALEQGPLTLDPALWSDVASGRIICLISSPLVRADREMRIVGDLAKAWDVSDDRRVFTFHLDPRARFSSGRKVTAEDVRFSLDRVLDPRTRAPRSWVLAPILGASERLQGKAASVRGITVLDAATVRLELKEPFAPFLHHLTMPVASVVPREDVLRLGDEFGRKPVGSGPFKFVSWTSDGAIELAANPPSHLGAPKLRGMRFRILGEPLTRVSEFRLGNLDVLAIPPIERPTFDADPVWAPRILARPGLNVYYVGLNCEKPPTRDVRVRRAIAMAIDKTSIVRSVRKGQGIAARGPIPPGLGGYDARFEGIPYDPDGARRLLAEAGFAGGFELELAQNESKDNLEVTQILASFLARVGVRVRITPFEWQTFKARVNGGLTQAFYLSWWADYADAENFLYPLYHSSQAGSGANHPRYRNPKLDAMLEEARRTPHARDRERLYSDIERIAVEDASRVPVFHKLDQIVSQPWIDGLSLYPIYHSNRYVDVQFDEKKLHGLEAR